MAKDQGLKLEIKMDRSGQIARATHSSLMRHVAKTAASIEGSAKRKIVEMGAVDTGNLLNSVGSSMLKPGTHQVTVGAEYGAYVNFGTRHMPPRPFFTQAFEEERPKFYEQIAAIMKALV